MSSQKSRDLGLTDDGISRLVVTDPEFEINPGSETPFQLLLDGEEVLSGMATAATRMTGGFVFDDLGTMVYILLAEQSLTLQTPIWSGTYRLEGSDQALLELLRCVVTQN